jgi:RND family efflux transporter MFP subunit
MRSPFTYAAAMMVVLATNASAIAQSSIKRSMSFDTQGVLSPYLTTDVATAEIGVLREVFVRPGDSVKQGTPMGRLDWDLQLASLQEVEMEASAMGAIEVAHHEVDFQQTRYELLRPRVEKEMASPQELERVAMELRIAKARLQSQLEARSQTQARLAKARIAFDERTIKSPHDGIVVEQVTEVGEYVAGNNPVLFKIVDISKLRARFSVPQELADRFRNKKTAEIRLPSNAVLEGEIEFIAPFESPEGGEIEMTILIDNPTGSVRYSKCSLVLP